MQTCPTRRFRCAVCGTESRRHAGWFLVVENTWLDRIKILSWHPLLAEQALMQSVCGRRHLQALITHWLTYANLQFAAARVAEFALPARDCGGETDPEGYDAGRLVGELAVHRESLSQLWTGSAEARESIFQALLEGLEARPSTKSEIRGDAGETPEMGSAAVRQLAGEFAIEYAIQ